MSNAEKCSTDLLCGIDQYGRAFMPVSGMDRKKDVGMFYFCGMANPARPHMTLQSF